MSDSHFHRESRGLKELASQLSQEERSGILEKLKKQKKMSTEPLYVHDLVIDREHLDSREKQYSRLPGITRFFYFLAGLFKGMPASKAFDEKKFDRLGKKVQSSASKYFNYDKRLLLSGFYELTGKLKDSVRFFYAAMNTGVTRDKGDFYAFMGSLELADVHAMLETFTSAEVVLEKRPGIKESELHSIMTKGMEDALKKIPEQKKNIMYNNARALYCFKELSSFQFDHLLLAFDSTISGRTCQVGHVRGMLTTLNNIFFSLGEPPSMSLMQSLINFMIQEKAGSKGYDIDGEMKALFASAEEAIGAIREFNKKIPLTQILRCVCRDMDLSPQQISGGEDWFFVYRDHWKHQLESSYAEYNRKHKQHEISKTFQDFFNGVALKTLENAASDNNPEGFPLPEAFALAFLRTFHSTIFMGSIDATMRPILFEGAFYKNENRDEFTGAFSDFTRIEEVIHKIDGKISSYGEYGMNYDQAQSGETSELVKMKKTQQAIKEASHEARNIITRSITDLTSMVNVLGGILTKEAGGKYDTLSNLEELGGKNQEAFIKGIRETLDKLQRVLVVIKDLETTASR